MQAPAFGDSGAIKRLRFERLRDRHRARIAIAERDGATVCQYCSRLPAPMTLVLLNEAHGLPTAVYRCAKGHQQAVDL